MIRGLIFGAVLFAATIGVFWAIEVAYQSVLNIAYRQLTTGQAAVISYTVPGSGVCRAVLVDDKRHGETCEGEK